jgi:hypothetical protein
MALKKNPAAVALGRLGGRAKAAAMSPAQRIDLGKRLADARRNIPAAERRRIARLAVEARERQRKQRKENR